MKLTLKNGDEVLIKVIHLRGNSFEVEQEAIKLSFPLDNNRPIQAATLVKIDIPARSLTLSGKACCSVLDNFSRHEGVRVAMTRAVESLSREEREQIWNKVWNLNKK